MELNVYVYFIEPPHAHTSLWVCLELIRVWTKIVPPLEYVFLQQLLKYYCFYISLTTIALQLKEKPIFLKSIYHIYIYIYDYI